MRTKFFYYPMCRFMWERKIEMVITMTMIRPQFEVEIVYSYRNMQFLREPKVQQILSSYTVKVSILPDFGLWNSSKKRILKNKCKRNLPKVITPLTQECSHHVVWIIITFKWTVLEWKLSYSCSVHFLTLDLPGFLKRSLFLWCSIKTWGQFYFY